MNKQIMGAILVFYLLIGCAAPQITPIPRGEPISIEFTRSPKADGVIDIRNEDLGSNAKTGAGTGATGGAVAGAIAGLTCGPFFIFCAPVFATAGAVVGTAAGAGVGAGVAIMGELSNEKAAQLRDRVGRVQQSHSLLSELQKNVNDRAQKYWKLGTDQSAALVTIELQDLQLSSMRNEQINCTIRVLLSVQRAVAKDSKTTEQKMYQYVAPTSTLSIWLDESSDFIDTLLTSASQQIAAQIVSDLAMTEVLAGAKFSEKNEEKANFLATPQAVPPSGTPVASRPNEPTFNPAEPWTGRWKVSQGRYPGIWSLTQRGDTVISTSDSDFKLEAKVYGDMIRGKWSVRGGYERDFQATIAEDGLSFNGAADYLALRNYFAAKKIE
jgi:hypothetical protein